MGAQSGWRQLKNKGGVVRKRPGAFLEPHDRVSSSRSQGQDRLWEEGRDLIGPIKAVRSVSPLCMSASSLSPSVDQTSRLLCPCGGGRPNDGS